MKGGGIVFAGEIKEFQVLKECARVELLEELMRHKKPETILFEMFKATIQQRLRSDPKWIAKAILVLYDRQTSVEQACEETHESNMRGFNKPDAKRLSDVAVALRNGGLRPEVLLGYGPQLQKYAGQLAQIAVRKEVEKAKVKVAG